MWDILQRETIYLWYYLDIQVRRIFWYWLLGMVIGSAISVFAKGGIHRLCAKLGQNLSGPLGWISASALGIASPLCMYGTIPICASFSQKGIKDDFLAAFMMSSILLNPQLILYSMALGGTALAVRILSCFFCGVVAGLAVHYAFRDKPFFNFKGFEEGKSRDTAANPAMRFLFNLGRNLRATGPWFLLGVVLSALFQRYVPADFVGTLFGPQKRYGLLLAATIGVPLYVCGGGTIPLLRDWLAEGMSLGAAASFMLTGPATKITNLGALKIVMGMKAFTIYLAFVILFSLLTGLLVNILLG
ncbi:MAG: permease [Victivallales bacterium]|nr:permease [Victivallales bacterium]